MRALFSLNPYLWKYKRHLITGILFVAASNLFAVYPAQIVRGAINMVEDVLGFYQMHKGSVIGDQVESSIFKSLLVFGAIVLVLALIRGVFLYLTRQTLIAMSRLIEYDLRKDLYDHLQSLDTAFYRENRTGDLMAKMAEDVGRVRMYLGPGIMYSINTLTLFVVVVTTMMTVNAELTLYALIPFPFLSYLVYNVESIIQRRSERIQRQLSVLTTFAQEIFSGIRVLKAYVKETPTYDKFSEESETFKEKSMHLAAMDALFFPLVVFLVGLSVVITVWVGGEKVIAGSLTLGNIAEFLMYINLLTWPIIAIGWVTTLIQRAAASQVRLNALFAERSDMTFKDSEARVASAKLTFDDVSFTYPDTGIVALTDVSFDLKPGQKLGIVGPTGSGKSTLCALIPRMYDPQYGDISLDGTEIKGYGRDVLRGSIGYAPQDVFLFSDTIKNNISFGKLDATQEEVEEAAKGASVYHNIVDFPEGFDTLVGERGVTLSGGQKQRISIARAWIRKPKLLIYDDVLSAVDTKTEESILSALRKYRVDNPETATIMVAHRISCIQDSDVIIVLEDGKITERGTHQQLVDRNGYYARIYEKQLSEGEEEAADLSE